MKTQDSYIAHMKGFIRNGITAEKILISTVLLLALSVSWFFWGLETSQLSEKGANTINRSHSTIDYVMGKIQTVMSLFSLEGREVKRTFIGLEESQKDANPTFNSKTVSGKTPSSPKGLAVKSNSKTDSKPISAVKPKTVNAGDTRVAKKSQKAQEDRKKLLEERRKQWEDYNSTMARNESQRKAKEEAALLRRQISEEMARASIPNQNTPSSINTNASDVQEKKKFKAIEDWRREILEASTTVNNGKETIVKFVAAYRAKEVTDIDFYQTIQTLLSSQNEAQKGLGLYALRGTPSYATYLLLVKQQKDFSPDYQKYIQDTLVAYNNGSLQTLQQALQSKDQSIIPKTLEVLKVGILAAKNGNQDPLTESRYRRDQDFVSLKLSNYSGFQQILSELSQSTTAGVAGLAQELSLALQSNPSTPGGSNPAPVVAGVN